MAARATKTVPEPRAGVAASSKASHNRLSRLRPRPTLTWTLIWFGLIRLVTVLLVFSFRPAGRDLLNEHGDIAWYVSIAEHGYRLVEVVGQTVVTSNMAFFPLTPTLMKPLMLLGVPALWAGLLVATAASVVAACALYRIGDHLYGQRVGCCLALTWACFLPTSIALSLPLSEALFTACAAWACYFLLTDRLITAAPVTALAGLSRPSVLALLAAVAWVALSKLFRRRQVRRAIVTLAIAPVGLLAYYAYVSLRTATPIGYLRIQRSYGSRVDLGYSWLRAAHRWVVEFPTDPVGLVAVGTTVVTIALLVLLLVKRVPAALTVYAIAALTLVFIQSGHVDMLQRFIIPIFPLLIPLAIGLGKLRWWIVAPILTAATIVTADYGAFLLYETKLNII